MVYQSPTPPHPSTWLSLAFLITSYQITKCYGFTATVPSTPISNTLHRLPPAIPVCSPQPRSDIDSSNPIVRSAHTTTTTDSNSDELANIDGGRNPQQTRRMAVTDTFRRCTTLLTGSTCLPLLLPSQPASAASITMDQMDSTKTDSTSTTFNSNNNNISQTTTPPTDEITVTIPLSQIRNDQGGKGLGIQLADLTYKSSRRVYVASIRPDSYTATQLPVQTDWILVSINGQSTERVDARGAAQMVSTALTETNQTNDNADGNLVLVFRDPYAFREQIQNLDSSSSTVASSRIVPKGDIVPDDETITVSQLIKPRYCQRKALVDDLLEISYLGTVVDTGTVFDGSAIKVNGQVVPGRGEDTTLYFVLGKQPAGQFPPSWDVGLEGICVGERRSIVVPPSLAFGSKGVPRRNIPPNAYLRYDVTLVSLNGLATP